MKAEEGYGIEGCLDGSIHDKALCDLANSLSQKPWMGQMWLKLPYNGVKNRKSHVNGEIDVLAYNWVRDAYYFYEVKSRDSQKNMNKAQEQFTRYRECHIGWDIRGFYVAEGKIYRLSHI